MGSGEPKSGRRLARHRRAKGGNVKNSNAFVLVIYFPSLLKQNLVGSHCNSGDPRIKVRRQAPESMKVEKTGFRLSPE
jgi:hypothetical protein